MVKYEWPLAPSDGAIIQWSDNLAELIELSQGTLLPAMAARMAQSAEEKAQELAEWRDYDTRWQHLENVRAELTEKYPDQWVALNCDWELMVADSLDAIIAKSEACGACHPQPVTKFMNTQPRRWIL